MVRYVTWYVSVEGVEQAMVGVHTVEPPIKTTTSEQRTSCHSFP